jgi:hypothetical protein
MKTTIDLWHKVWPDPGAFVRASAQDLERFAELVRADEREACAKTRAGKPRELKPVGRSMLLDEQQFCFDKGWCEGAASVSAAIRARGLK